MARPAVSGDSGVEAIHWALVSFGDVEVGSHLAGKTVGVIGTGASAIQFVPQIVPRVGNSICSGGHLRVFFHKAVWRLTKNGENGFATCREQHGLSGNFSFFSLEWRVLAFLGNLRVRRFFERIARRHLEGNIKEANSRAALTPHYEMGCKRVLLSDDFYPALRQPHVELVTEKIAEIRRNSVVTGDGVERPADVLIFGTGFQVTAPFIGMRLIGRGRVEIPDAWRNGMKSRRDRRQIPRP